MNVEQTFIGTNYTYDLNQELNSIRIIKGKNPGIDYEDNNSSSSMFRPKTILVFGIVLGSNWYCWCDLLWVTVCKRGSKSIC